MEKGKTIYGRYMPPELWDEFTNTAKGKGMLIYAALIQAVKLWIEKERGKG